MTSSAGNSLPAAAVNPLIIYPSVESVLPAFGFPTGCMGSGIEQWDVHTAGALGSVTLVTGEGERSGNAARYIKTAGTGTLYMELDNTRYAPFLYAGTDLLLTHHLRLKCTAQSGGGKFYFRLAFYDSAGAFISYGYSQYVVLGTDLAADGGWVTFRLPKSSQYAVPAGTAGVRAQLGFLDSDTATGTVYVDYVIAGGELNFYDWGPPPSTRGAFFRDTFPNQRQFERRQQKASDGSVETQLWNDGFQDGDVTSTPLKDGDRDQILTFVDYVTRGAPFTLWLDQTRHDLDFVLKAAWDPAATQAGLTQIPGGYHAWNLKYLGVA